MYETQKIPIYLPLNAQNVLKCISESDIFRYYCNIDVQVGMLFVSPLRYDRHPTCSFYVQNSKLKMKDFATGFTGDAFDLVREMFSCSFNDALKKINQDFNLGLGVNGNGVNLGQIKQKEIMYVQRERPLIQIRTTKFKDSDLKYWQQYGISRETLQKFDVHCVQDLYIGKNLVAKKKDSNPIYAYYFKDSDNLKIYQPMSPYKWISNVTADDIQGYQMFKPDNNLIITSSLKDVMTLYEAGYMAVAPQGEGNKFTDPLKDMIGKSTKVSILYDNDGPGILNAHERARENNIQEIIILPEGPKDPSDFVKAHGLDELKILMNGCTN